MPGKPAARVGDQSAHGGAITGPGAPTVMIAKKPAAVMGDMHSCPMVNPDPAASPHVGGPVQATAVTVKICGKPAARVGDMATCSGPPDSIVVGCPTVLIGDGGGGAGAGSGGGATTSATTGEAEAAENHYLDVKFVDKAGNAITGVKYKVKTPDNEEHEGALTGKIKKSGLKEGSCKVALKAITKAAWSKKQAEDGEKVKMQAEGAGFADDAKAVFEVWEKNANRADRMVAAFEDIDVKGGKAEAEWTYEFGDEEIEDEEERQKKPPARYSSPLYYFIVRIDGVQARSPLLEYKDTIKIELYDEDDKPAAGEQYRIYLSSGEVRKGKLDSKGQAKEKGIRPGRCRVDFPEAGEVD